MSSSGKKGKKKKKIKFYTQSSSNSCIYFYLFIFLNILASMIRMTCCRYWILVVRKRLEQPHVNDYNSRFHD